jgi:hypothetical protein
LRRRLWLATLLFGLLSARTAPSQTLLHWKLEPGEQLKIKTTQETRSDVAYGGKTTTTHIDLAVELAWQVIAADAGMTRMKQTVTRASADVRTQDGGRLTYDSTNSAKPAGRTRDLADALLPLVGAEFQIAMNQRGEIIDVKPANKPAENLISQGDAAQQPAAAKQAIQQLLKQPLALLPESSVRPDDTWTAESELDTALGKAKHKTTYRFTGVEERDGRKLERIESSTTLGIEGNAPDARKLRIKEHQQTGTLWFDSAAGRLVSAEQNQKLVTERPYRDTTIVVTLESKQQTKVSKL